MMCFLKFSITRSEQEFFFKRQILIFGCQCVAKYIEGRQGTYFSLLCLNLPHDDRQCFVNLSLDGGQNRFKTKVLTRGPNLCNVRMAAA